MDSLRVHTHTHTRGVAAQPRPQQSTTKPPIRGTRTQTSRGVTREFIIAARTLAVVSSVSCATRAIGQPIVAASRPSPFREAWAACIGEGSSARLAWLRRAQGHAVGVEQGPAKAGLPCGAGIEDLSSVYGPSSPSTRDTHSISERAMAPGSELSAMHASMPAMGEYTPEHHNRSTLEGTDPGPLPGNSVLTVRSKVSKPRAQGFAEPDLVQRPRGVRCTLYVK